MEKRSAALANRLKQVCQEKNITYRELGDKIGMPAKRIQRIAYGLTENPGIYTIISICDGLEISLDEFFNTEEFKEMRG